MIIAFSLLSIGYLGLGVLPTLLETAGLVNYGATTQFNGLPDSYTRWIIVPALFRSALDSGVDFGMRVRAVAENAQRSLQRSLTIDECKGEKECAFCKKSVENVCGIRFCGLSVSHLDCFSF